MLQIGADQICLLQVGAREIGIPQERMVQLHPPENRARKIMSRKIGRGEVAAPPSSPVRLEIEAVRTQNLCELFARHVA